MYSKIFVIFLFIDLCYCKYLFEFIKYPQSYQPNRSIQDKFLLKNPQITFNKIYKRHNFGEIFTFSPLNDLCNDEYNKNLAKKCLKNSPTNWWCIYDAYISPSRPKFHYVKITLPPLYKDNNITETCELFT
jgi:hypothetical protein